MRAALCTIRPASRQQGRLIRCLCTKTPKCCASKCGATETCGLPPALPDYWKEYGLVPGLSGGPCTGTVRTPFQCSMNHFCKDSPTSPREPQWSAMGKSATGTGKDQGSPLHDEYDLYLGGTRSGPVHSKRGPRVSGKPPAALGPDLPPGGHRPTVPEVTRGPRTCLCGRLLRAPRFQALPQKPRATCRQSCSVPGSRWPCPWDCITAQSGKPFA